MDRAEKERVQLIDKIEKQQKEIKVVCCNYFEKYDQELTVVKKGLYANADKYGEWKTKLIEPSSFNDARLFALETRVNEEEEVRFA